MSRLLDRTPLRVKLVAALLALVTLGLVATGLAATTLLRGYLLDRLDEQLGATAAAVAARVDNGNRIVDRSGRALVGLPTDSFVRLSAPDGTTLQAFQVERLGRGRTPTPPVEISSSDLVRGRHLTIAASDGDGAGWRAATAGLHSSGGIVTVAVPLDDVRQTVARLGLIVLLVSLAVLALLAGLAYAVVRSSLRPLGEVEATAAAIAAGDLSQRVPERDPRTEVGRLSRALNGMLAQIESAFGARAESEASARASEERMRRFVADASHELRTPLTSIRGFAELYRQGAATEPDDVARILRRVEDEAARMGLLVDDLLLLARLDQQRPLQRRPVDLLAVASDAVTDARAVQPERPVELRVLGTHAPVVTGDEDRIRQVVGNLVTNALTHTPGGTPVQVTVGSDDSGAVLEVADEGPGMGPEQAARVFERFYRVDTHRGRSSGGSGLGLSIVAALVAAHGGTVTVDTAKGRGTTFRVHLPLAAGELPAPPPASPGLYAPTLQGGSSLPAPAPASAAASQAAPGSQVPPR